MCSKRRSKPGGGRAQSTPSTRRPWPHERLRGALPKLPKAIQIPFGSFGSDPPRRIRPRMTASLPHADLFTRPYGSALAADPDDDCPPDNRAPNAEGSGLVEPDTI